MLLDPSDSCPDDDAGGSRYLPPTKWQEITFYETYKSQITLVVEGLKLLVIANGGAAVALLTLLGSLAGRCTTLPSMTLQIGLFALGLVISIVGFFTSYVAQMTFLKWLATKSLSWKRGHVSAFVGSVVSISLSVILFSVAAVWAASEFQTFAPSCVKP